MGGDRRAATIERSVMRLFLSGAVCGPREATTPPARRPSAGWGHPRQRGRRPVRTRAPAQRVGRRERTGRFALTFHAEDALHGVLGGYGFSFVFSSSFRHLAACAGLPQAA